MARISSRLDKIEQTATPDTAVDLHATVVELLGRRDALYWPWRVFDVSRTEIQARQRDYLAGNVGLPVKASGAADWKAAHERRKRLIDAGLAAGCFSGGQVVSLLLTPLGEAIARRLCDLHTFLESLPVLKRLLEIREETGQDAARRQWSGQPWISESRLLNEGQQLIGESSSWDHKTEAVLPLLTAGMVEASSDHEGRDAYRLACEDLPKQLVVIGKWESDHSDDPGMPEVKAVDLDIQPSDEMHSRYIAAFNQEVRYLSTVEPRDPSEVFIGLRRLDYDYEPAQK